MNLSNLYSMITTVPNFPKEGVFFKDIMTLFYDPFARKALASELKKTIPSNVDVIVAPESRGLMLACLLSDLPVQIVPLRKKGKLPGKLYSITYDTEYSVDTLECQQIDLTNRVCWFIDDISCTLGTYEAASKLVSMCGGSLSGGTILLDISGKASNLVELFKEVK